MMENAFSIGDIARRLEVPLHRVEYLENASAVAPGGPRRQRPDLHRERRAVHRQRVASDRSVRRGVQWLAPPSPKPAGTADAAPGGGALRRFSENLVGLGERPNGEQAALRIGKGTVRYSRRAYEQWIVAGCPPCNGGHADRCGASTWQRVSKRRPCPVCERPDWCMYAGPDDSPTAVICPPN